MTAKMRPVLVWVSLALMLVTALLILRGKGVARQELRIPFKDLPLAVGNWRAVGKDEVLDERTQDVLRPQNYLIRRYVDPHGRRAALFLAYFGLQEEGVMIHSPRHCLPGSGWQIASRETVTIPGPGGGYKVNHLILNKELGKFSVLYWYQGRGKVRADEYVERLSLLVDGIFLDRTDGALVRITSAMIPETPNILKKQIKLAAALIPLVNDMLPPPGAAKAKKAGSR